MARGTKSTTGAKVRIAPFSMNVRTHKKGFVCEFRGLNTKGQVIEVELEFPRWWIAEIGRKLKKGTNA